MQKKKLDLIELFGKRIYPYMRDLNYFSSVFGFFNTKEKQYSVTDMISPCAMSDKISAEVFIGLIVCV